MTIEAEWLDWQRTCLPTANPFITPEIIPMLRDCFYAGAVSSLLLMAQGEKEDDLLAEARAKSREFII